MTTPQDRTKAPPGYQIITNGELWRYLPIGGMLSLDYCTREEALEVAWAAYDHYGPPDIMTFDDGWRLAE